ncbi:MAG: prolipoprotein diacylglyceryl transferase [Candidatus Peribacteraceae bacterium]|jgi:phosphatidylglycerol:prolipoprotein diacylglycerol transferase|nr:prolipoprotein diacylglyceryl transferase [Candidatus Peribacteraceae bacterium]|tara:strand:- start:437 stop:1213 length:777 start_codon:yes stop_codon:yes gene_type:complete
MIDLFPTRTVAISLAGFNIHWYGLMYMLAFLLAFYLLPRIQKWRGLNLSRDDWSSLLALGVIGVIAGGRLGFVLFYEPAFYLANPVEIIKVWNGGMSSHGGLIGVGIAIVFFSWKKGINIFSLLDVVVIPGAIGLAMGRMGNLINGELYGIESVVPWAMQFAEADGLRHPTQIYAIMKNLIIAGVCTMYIQSATSKKGQVFALFLGLYGLLRYIVEYYREQPYGIYDFGFVMMSRGQVLTIPIICLGAIVWCVTKRGR